MRMYKQFFKSTVLAALVSTGFAAYGIAQDTTAVITPEAQAPIILETSPTGGEVNVALGDVIEITFSNEMDETSINETTLLLHATYTDTMHEMGREMMMEERIRDRSQNKDAEIRWDNSTSGVDGTISYSNKVAVFTPNEDLSEGTMYTFTVTTGVKDVDNVPLQSNESWSFTTTGTTDSTNYEAQNNSDWSGMEESEESPKQASSTQASSANETKIIDLGKASYFVILAKEDVNNETGSKIMGHIGEGSLADSARKETDAMNSEWQSGADKKLVSQSNQSDSDTSSANVTKALEDMMTAYSNAAMQNGNDLTTHNTENFEHTPELTPGVHEWSDSLNIASQVTLSGSADDVWIFKADKDLTVEDNTIFTLTDGAQAENVFWYVEGEVTIGENAQFAGIILSMNDITLEKGAQLNGRMYSQTSINLNDNTITEPRSMAGQTTSKNK